MKNTLFERTKALASNLPETVRLEDVCREAGVTKRWWQYVISGHIEDPGVKRIQMFHDTLVQHGATVPRNGSA